MSNRDELAKVLFDHHKKLWEARQVKMLGWKETTEENRESWRSLADVALKWMKEEKR